MASSFDCTGHLKVLHIGIEITRNLMDSPWLRGRQPTPLPGEFHRQECMFKTLSDAINIQVPYNMERIFYYLTGTSSTYLLGRFLDLFDPLVHLMSFLKCGLLETPRSVTAWENHSHHEIG